MKNSLVALRYSKALINYSENKKASKKVYEEMKVISKIFSQNKKVLNFFSNPVVSIKNKKNLIFKLINNIGIKREKAVFDLSDTRSSPHIVQRYESFLQRFPDGRPYHCLVLELCDFNLSTYINILHHPENMDKDKYVFLSSCIHDIMSGLAWMHSHNFTHRDIKPENILVKTDQETKKWVLKLADFNSAVKTDATNSETYVATRWYRSPEALFELPQKIGPPIDIWAAGIVFYQILNRYPPVMQDSHEAQKDALCKYIFKRPEQAVLSLLKSTPLKQLYIESRGTDNTIDNIIIRCLGLLPELRPTCDQILEELKSDGRDGSD